MPCVGLKSCGRGEIVLCMFGESYGLCARSMDQGGVELCYRTDRCQVEVLFSLCLNGHTQYQLSMLKISQCFHLGVNWDWGSFPNPLLPLRMDKKFS